MAICAITSVKDNRLKELLSQYGQAEGLRKWLEEKEGVNYSLRVINSLFKIQRNVFDSSKLQGWLNDLTKQGVSNQQLELFKEIAKDGMSKEDIIIELASKYNFNVEVNISKSDVRGGIGGGMDHVSINRDDYTEFELDGSIYKYDFIEFQVGEDEEPSGINEFIKDDDNTLTEEEYEKAFDEYKRRKFGVHYSEVYSHLTVPGGTNYRENEISTPLITPSIKGHAQFSTDNGIGWFRSDESNTRFDSSAKNIINNVNDIPVNDFTYNNHKFYKKNNKWFEKLPEYVGDQEMADSGILRAYNSFLNISGKDFKTRRILEVQSDLFQKGRNEENLNIDKKIPYAKNVFESTIKNIEGNIDNYKKALEAIKTNDYRIILPNNDGRYVASVESTGVRAGTIPIAENPYTKEAKEGKFDIEYAVKYLKERIKKEESFIADEKEKYKESEKIINKNIESNKFLQLLNKDNNWVTFFIKSIVQDSAKKGYEKVLFPKGETAAKVEGHETLATRIEAINYELEELNKGNTTDGYDIDTETGTGSLLQIIAPNEERRLNRIKELEKEKADLKSQGIEKLKPIEAFYEIKIANVLKKQGYKPEIITDEYGNTWNEITLKPEHKKSIDLGLTGNESESEYIPTKRSLEYIASSFGMLNTGFLSKKADITQVRQSLNRNGFGNIGIKSNDYGYYFIHKGKMVNPYKKTIKRLEELNTEDLGLTGKAKVVDHKDIFAKIVSRYEQQIKLLEKRLGVISKKYGTTTPDAKKQIAIIEKLIADKKKKIENLEEDKSYANLLSLAEEQAKEIEMELRRYTINSTKNLSEEALKSSMERLVELSLFINSWEDINELIPTKITDELHAKIQAVYGTYKGFKSVYLDLIKTYFVKITNKISYDTINPNNMFDAIEDTNIMVMGMMSAAHSTSNLVKVTKDIIDHARDKAHIEFMKKKRRIETLDETMERLTGIKGIEKWDVFFQRRKDGSKTGNFLNEYIQEYYDIIKDLKARYKAGKLTSKEYYAERRKHENLINLNLYNNRAIGIFTEEDYKEQDRLLKLMQEDHDNYMQEVKDSGLYHNPDGSFKDASAQVAYENQGFIDLDQRDPFKFNSMSRNYRIPAKPLDKYRDPAFEKLFKPGNEELLKAYTEMMDILRTNNDSLPRTSLYHKSRTYIPEQLAGSKLSMELLLKEGRDLFVESISDDIDSRITIGDKTIKSVPITMMSNKIDADKKSYDIKQVLINHTAMAMNYKHLSNVVPIAEAAMDILDEMEEIKTGKSGESVSDAEGVTMRKKKRLSHTKQHLRDTIDVLLYQEKAKTEGKLYKMGMSKDAKAELAILEEKLANGEIIQEEFNLEKRKIADEYITASKVTDTLIRYTYLKALSFPNIAAPAVNLFFGLMSNLTYAAGGVDFTTDEVLKATGLMMQAVSKTIGNKLHPEAVERIYGWMERLNVLGEVNESLYSHKRTFSDKAVFLQVHAEKVNQGSVMIAMLKSQKLKDASGKEIALWDAYKVVNGELVWDQDKMGTEEAVDIFRLKKKVEAVIHRIHGDYTSPMGFKRYALGRAMLLFRTWMPAAINERFGREDFNHDLGREVKGRYRSLLWATDNKGEELNFPKIIGRLAKSLLFMDGFSDLAAVDKENLKRDLRELIIVASLATVALMLRSLAANLDDDEEAEWGLNYMSNILGKTTSDIIGFAWPGAMTQVLSNPITIMKTVKDLSQIYPAISKTIQGDPVYQSGPWKGHNRIGKWVTYQIPGLYGAAKTITAGEKIYEFY